MYFIQIQRSWRNCSRHIARHLAIQYVNKKQPVLTKFK